MATQRAKATKTNGQKTSRAHTSAVPFIPMAQLDVTTQDAEGRTPLHLAAFYGYANTVDSMLHQHADANARDNHQRTPGHWAAFKGHLAVVKLLLEFNADINARDDEGRTMLRMALAGRQEDVETLLREHGAEL
ncbi:MAG TPA: ankyrin repeat domain-containing protein [Armatimonadota bacterium]|nr:ankyrin repeat domain-containing protein [Armatimonadota bacterium]